MMCAGVVMHGEKRSYNVRLFDWEIDVVLLKYIECTDNARLVYDCVITHKS